MNDKVIVQPNMAELYQTYFASVYGYVFYRLLRREDTEDVVSRIFIKVHSNLDRYHASKALIRTWIFRIVEIVKEQYYTYFAFFVSTFSALSTDFSLQ